MICPYCKEEIADGAIKCKHCQSMLATISDSSAPPEAGQKSEKTFIATLLLCFFLGSLGVHRFYAGKGGTGFGQLALCLGGIIMSVAGLIEYYDYGIFMVSLAAILGGLFLVALGVWVVIDFITIAVGSFKDKDGRPIKN